ncbi:MAG: carboxypeptidase [Planctomycetota bacterium]|nr:MAG: carboxypeptidase [Planctomycetota bacterium]
MPFLQSPSPGLLTATILVLVSGPAFASGGTGIAEQYLDPARRIMDHSLSSVDGWHKLEELCDGIGHRLSGSPRLEKALNWAIAKMKEDGQENVRGEPVKVPKWVRGRESLTMHSPQEYDIAMLGLGMSVGTPPEGITAEVLVVADEKELEAAGTAPKGKFVLFNNPMPAYDEAKGSGYGSAVRFRHKGAQLAAARGAVACLVRSVTAKSLRTPHTGAMSYGDAGVRIPAAAVSIEDAEMISRLCRRGERVRLTLKMEARDEGMVDSANVIGELRGREKPEEVVVIGGHIDAWDVGHGAHDDGAGCVMAMEAINVLRKLKLIPRRTIRVVLWTNEENGLGGGREYARAHAAELDNHIAAIESDSGCFAPKGFSVECADPAREELASRQLAEIVRLLEPIGATKVSRGGSGADISPMKPAGVLLMGFSVDGSRYFDYHHSHADTLDKVDPKHLQQCVAAMAVTAYVLADMPDRLGGPPTRSPENAAADSHPDH